MREQDIRFITGDRSLPLCVLIHGLGMNHHMWDAPELTPVMGGAVTLKSLLNGCPDQDTILHDLRSLGYPIATWSQRRPVGPISEAIAEMKHLLTASRVMSDAGVVLIGHSRGGLVARAAASEVQGLRAVITICAPHGGTELARWAAYFSKPAAALSEFLPDESRARLAIILKRMLGFVQSKGVSELLPESEFIRSLPMDAPRGVYSMSIGGTNPSLKKLPGGLSIPDSLALLMPRASVPDEIKAGLGDGLVSAAQARLPYADEHLDFDASHVSIIVLAAARQAIVERVKRLS